MIISTAQAVRIIEKGGIIIYPTDTAFGIGCRIDDTEAIKKLFSIRERPLDKAVPVLFNSVEMVEKYVVSIPESVNSLLSKYWPGALTVVLPANLQKVSSLVRGGGLGVGCRVPGHNAPLEIISGVGVPIVGTSANFSGEPTPYKMSDINPKLISLADGIVSGEVIVKKESTVIDCTQDKWEILRQGAIRIYNL